MRRGENNIRHGRCSRNKRGDEDVQTVCRNGREIARTATNLFVYDDISTTRQINRLIRLTRYRDSHTVDPQVAKKSTLANRWSTLKTRALRTLCHNVGGKSVATDIQIQIFDNGLRPALVKGTLSYCVESSGGERAAKQIT